MLSIYSNVEVLSILRIFKIAINSFKIIVPILLIITLIIDYKKAVSTREIDIIEQVRAASVSKILAAILIFSIPTFIQIIISTSQIDSEYKIYLENATIENIKNAYNERPIEYIKAARENQTLKTYQIAKNSLVNVSNLEKKAKYEDELKQIKLAIETKEMIEKVKISKKNTDYKEALDSLEKISDRELKNELNKELEKVSYTMIKYVDEYSSNGNYINSLLNLPYYDQCDLRWKDVQYDISMSTICSSGSGYTSFSMIAAGFNKDMTITPVTIISKMRGVNLKEGELSKKGYGATSLAELTNTNVLNYYKLKAKIIEEQNEEKLKQAIIEELNLTKAVIILVPGHYMVLAPSEDGNIILLDPKSNWNNKEIKTGKQTIDKIWNAYGGIIQAISYEKK